MLPDLGTFIRCSGRKTKILGGEDGTSLNVQNGKVFHFAQLLSQGRHTDKQVCVGLVCVNVLVAAEKDMSHL